MFSVIINIILAALVLVPVIYFSINRKKTISSEFNDFLQSIKNQSGKIDQQMAFSESYLALDVNGKTLYAKKSGEPLMTIPLKNGTTCTVLRNFESGNTTSITSASLQIIDSSLGKYTIPLFGHDSNVKFDESEILDVVDWESKIKSCIAK
ncbi:MAG: hypothetical protein R2774_02190 [Saprospiraceae bacterium]